MKRYRRQRGLSLLEVLMLLMILGILGATAGSSLLAIAKSPKSVDDQLTSETALVTRMEYLRSLPFDSLTPGYAIPSFSDSQASVDIDWAAPQTGGALTTNYKRIKVYSPGGMYLETRVNKP